jgi:type II secretory pathway pseudopilin PulG
MVAVTLFAVVMLVAVGALLSLVDANRKARALESVMNNLNIAVDGMVRSIRMGNTFNCGAVGIPSANSDDGDCPNGDPRFSFAPFGSDPMDPGERWVYFFQDNQLWRSRTGSFSDAVAITAPEVRIDDVTFYVVGTARGNSDLQDTTQPKVVIVVKGTTNTGNDRTETTFYLQATAVQRVLDL